jgi:hypothetical protein
MLVLTDRSRFDHAHTVADLAGVILVMGLEFGDPSKHFPIEWVNNRTLDFDNHGLIHLIADHTSDPLAPFIC